MRCNLPKNDPSVSVMIILRRASQSYPHNLMDLSIVLSLGGGKAVKKGDKFGNHFSIKCLRQPRQLRKRRVYSIRDKQR